MPAATAGTFVLEMGLLSRLSGDPRFEEAALASVAALVSMRSPLGLYGTMADVYDGRWTRDMATVGAMSDSFYEYLLKGEHGDWRGLWDVVGLRVKLEQRPREQTQ